MLLTRSYHHRRRATASSASRPHRGAAWTDSARFVVAMAIVWLSLSASAGTAFAFDIVGRVVNGTTGEPVHPATVRIVNPSGGMLVENETKTLDDSGGFRVTDLSSNAPVYLIRVDYGGTNYTEMVRPMGEEATVEITVYETTVSWDHVHVNLPHVIIERSNDTLQVEKFYEVANHTDPPKSVFGADANFRFYLPDDRLSVGTEVMALGMPLPVNPTQTDEEGIYSISYPMRPGATRVSVALALPYDGGSYKYVDKFAYKIGTMTIATSDPTIQVTSETNAVETIDDFHGFRGFRIRDLGPDTPLQLTISGGSGVAAAPMGGARPQISVIPSEVFGLSIALLVLVVFVLVGALIANARQSSSGDAEHKLLEEQKDTLLDQLARLDNLHKMKTVSDTIYKIKRAELVNALAQVYYLMQTGETEGNAARGKDAARV